MTNPFETVTFTRAGFLRGFRQTFAPALGVGAYGLLFGALAMQAGLTIAQALVMSATVFAGASQLVAVEAWSAPPEILAITLATFVINLRHVLMGAALAPWFSRVSPGRAYLSVYFMADENWAMTMKARGQGETDAAHLIGGGAMVWVVWFATTWIGAAALEAMGDPRAIGLDFAFTAVFLALLCGMWRGRTDLLPWLAAAAAALLTERLAPGKWYILAGGLAAGLVGALAKGDES
ncbi:AzlC family ABC transporter permease [Desulfohalovibrio reitneri]|uniref:AzlC family ABC transporter permease n=1 Tax=Desulfohalovibrio reitneri TaxID=1307759 RepID=UPI000559162A|nr:AzlC family ABC transporter permease [Desulfohalovibrio reitneri]